MKNYSKTVVKWMVILWFVGAVFGGTVVVVELAAAIVTGSAYGTTVHLPDLLNYIGIPMSCAIAGYLAKSAFENREKIRQNPGYREHGGA